MNHWRFFQDLQEGYPEKSLEEFLKKISETIFRGTEVEIFLMLTPEKSMKEYLVPACVRCYVPKAARLQTV